MREQVFSVVIDGYISIYQEDQKSLKFYDDFLINSIEIKTLAQIGSFISGENYRQLIPKDETDKDSEKQAKKIFEEITINLRGTLFNFVKNNIRELEERKVFQELPSAFLGIVIIHLTEALNADQTKSM